MALVNVTEDTFQATVEAEGITLVDCWATWCGPCRSFLPIYEKAAEQHEDLTFAKLNTEENQGLAAALQIMSIPTLMVFRDGVLVYREAGALPAAALEDLISQVRALDMDDVRRQIAEAQQNNEA
ncbi:thioredoxin [Corynebacterium sp. HS2168-gen11]|uniref:thioredoxin n=1 Tax=Corynebacterium sp. HS2168-gen11 TaxID=2974027 RepID=UPI00216AD56D|nr:thioredoxin [Corynebacterium sp. HS2168-gen11]MCS4536469.1 thioredoxin [Corynebacterium sp. HS2168-gen11]